MAIPLPWRIDSQLLDRLVGRRTLINMTASNKQTQAVDATITLLKLSGVKCHSQRGRVITSGFKRLSAKSGDYADVNDNSDAISSEPNVRAVVSFQHDASEGNGGIRNILEQHLPSLPMGEESRDAHSNIILSGVWPCNDRCNSIQFSPDIHRLEIDDEQNTRTEMTIPASASLRVGLMIDGSDDIQPLGIATVLISGKEQTLELNVPVEAVKKKQKISPKSFFNHAKKSSMHSFQVSGLTVLKIKLAVVAKPHDSTVCHVRSSAASIADVGSKKIPNKAFVTDLKIKSRLCRVRDSTIHQVNSLKTKAVIALNATRARSSVRGIDVDVPVHRFLPELTVLPPSGDSNTQTHDGATEIVLHSSIVSAHDFDASKIASIIANSFDGCSIVTELNQASTAKKNDSTSVSTQRTRSSSDRSSREGFSEIVITASRVAFEELSTAQQSQPSPTQAALPSSEDLFAKDVTTQLDEIVKEYSMRVNEQNVCSIADVSSDDAIKKEGEDTYVIQSTTTASDVSSKGLIDQPQRSTQMLPDTLTDAETSPKAAVEDLTTTEESQHMPKDECIHSDAFHGVQSVMLTHEDETGTVYTVEVSVDGENIPRTAPLQTDVEAKDNGEEHHVDANQSQIQRESSHNSHHKTAKFVVTPIEIFEGGVISVSHTMSSIGELTEDSALDTSTIPSVISKSLKVARNRRHPQRKEAANFLRQVTVCGREYDIAELMDDAVVGWRDIVVGDDLCDGMDEFVCEGNDNDSDDETATFSLNTMDERVPSKSSFFSGVLCRERKIAHSVSQDESM